MAKLAQWNDRHDPVSERPTPRSSGALLRVALIVGDNCTPHCGVKDYAHSLAGALAGAGLHADVLAPQRWDRASLVSFREQLRRGRYDILHLQYPSVGHRASLLPHVLGLFKLAGKSLVTLHEHSALPVAQALSVQAFRWSTSTLLWASAYEQGSFNRRLGSLGAPQHVVPLGSNVPSAEPDAPPNNTVVYFGQIRRNKGLEDFLELARICVHEGRSYRFQLIGSVTPANADYAKALRFLAPPSVQWSFDLPFAEVGKTLSASLAAYLPFPDGASERRGSMLAAFANGVPVLSQAGPATTQVIKDLMIEVKDPVEALGALDRLSSMPSTRAALADASRQYARRHTWPRIAERHVEIYQSLLRDQH